jgi:hypothetical protein
MHDWLDAVSGFVYVGGLLLVDTKEIVSEWIGEWVTKKVNIWSVGWVNG